MDDKSGPVFLAVLEQSSIIHVSCSGFLYKEHAFLPYSALVGFLFVAPSFECTMAEPERTKLL